MLRLVRRLLRLPVAERPDTSFVTVVTTMPPPDMTPEEKARFHKYHSSNQWGM